LIDPRLFLCLAAGLISVVVAFQLQGALHRMFRRSASIGPRGRRRERISVIIPARNEEQDIGRALESVLAQEDVDLEAIVVNDHSTDRTGAIADQAARLDPRLRVIHDPELPPGWLGKCNAMEQAARRAQGDLFLFTDADINFEPTCFRSAVDEMERRDLDLFSLFPRMDCVSLWENILLPCLEGGVAVLATAGIEDPKSTDALAAGAFLLIKAPVFHAIGGLASIQGEIADDLALARRVKACGYRVALRAAPELLNVRLYKGNRHAFWAMTKNILVGLHGRLWLAPFVIILPVFVFWTPAYCAIAGAAEGNLALALTGVGVYALQIAIFCLGRRLFRFSLAKVLLFPLVALPVICCMTRACYLYLWRGAVEWRGRTIRVRQG
jgi:glycosyltransferase involved in cell wall biosynthesis